MDNRILRVIDANYNRVLEGLRVCEEITRFVLCDQRLTRALKEIRHNVVGAIARWKVTKASLLGSRNSEQDVGKPSLKDELKRHGPKDIFYANMQRAKESVRVLEECAKLSHKKVSGIFKNIRYTLYAIEKKTHPKL